MASIERRRLYKGQPLPAEPSVPLAEMIEQRIFLLRGHRVILSPDLADLYEVEPRVLIQAVNRNIERFPEDFMFQLNDDEFRALKSQIVISSWGGLRRAREVRVGTWREVMREEGTTAIERGERAFAPGDHVMFLKNGRELGVKNGTLGTVAEVNRDSMRVVLDGPERCEVSFNLLDYAALDYGYAATIHKAQGATVDHSFVLATPGMDRHLAYVGMTRHREGAELYAGRDAFKDFEELKDRLPRARPKDSTLDCAQRPAGWRPPASRSGK